MGMDPATIGMITAAIGGPMMGGLMAPEGQELQSFEGRGDLDPAKMMGEGRDMIGDLLSSLMDDAGKDVTMKTTVNPMPSFVGGSMPMPISAPGMDANRMNPALRTTPGLQIPRRRLTGGTGASPTDTGLAPAQRTPPYIPPPEDRMPGDSLGRLRNPNSREARRVRMMPIQRGRPNPGYTGVSNPRGGGGEAEQAMQALSIMGLT